MAGVLDPQLKRALAERVRFYNELGIYDFYRRDPAENPSTIDDSVIEDNPVIQPEQREPMVQRSRAVAAVPVVPEQDLFDVGNSKPVIDRAQALRVIREDLGDCTRCRLHKQGRKQIVFGVGNPKAELMFIGEAPG